MENTIAFLARFPMPAIVLSAVLTLAHLTLRMTDWPSGVLFLQPANTVTRPHQVLTAGLFEDSAPSLLVAVPALLLSAKVLAPEWGDRETVRFLVLVNVLHACATWLSMILLYVLFREEHFLFARLSGCGGLLGGLAVAVKQQVVQGKLRVDEQPAWVGAALSHVVVLHLGWSVLALTLLRAGPPDELLLATNGVIAAWAYLRFYQPRAGGAAGDASPGFSFAALFPGPVQPPLRVLGTVCFGVVSSCGCFPPLGWDTPVSAHVVSWPPVAAGAMPVEDFVNVLSADAAPLPTVTTDDPEVAERRRARARALLEERLQKASNTATAPAAAPEGA